MWSLVSFRAFTWRAIPGGVTRVKSYALRGCVTKRRRGRCYEASPFAPRSFVICLRRGRSERFGARTGKGSAHQGGSPSNYIYNTTIEVV